MNIDELFDYHPSNTPEAIAVHTELRREVKAVAQIFDEDLPTSAEKTLAIRKLQEALMWANAAIAIYGVS